MLSLHKIPLAILAAFTRMFGPLIEPAPVITWRPMPRYRRRTGIRNISPAHSSSVRKLQRLERQAEREAAGR